MKTPRAFTLIEMVTSISVGSVLLVLAMGTVHRTMRIDSNMRENALAERSAARLSCQFRHDIHRAESVSFDHSQQEKTVMQIEIPGQSPIVYRIEDAAVHREQSLENSQTHREHFPFPKNFVVNIQELSDPSRAVLIVQCETGLKNISPRLQLHVEAVVSQFLRHNQPTEASP